MAPFICKFLSKIKLLILPPGKGAGTATGTAPATLQYSTAVHKNNSFILNSVSSSLRPKKR